MTLLESIQHHIASVVVSDDDLDMGFSEDFISGKFQLSNGAHDLYLKGNVAPQPAIAPERAKQAETNLTVKPNSQDWAGMDGATAFLLIDRHADGWDDTRLMMHEWLAANANQAEAVPLFWYRPKKDGLYEGPIHANSIFGKSYREENPSEWRPLYTAPPTQAAEAMRDAYEAGWAKCARWANRSDLVFDVDSPAYKADRESALAAITPNHFADAGKPITKHES